MHLHRLSGLSSILVLLSATACTTLPARERNFDPSLCNKGAAYEAGFNDGQDGRAMSSSFLDTCREDLRSLGQEGYRTGYDAGHVLLEQRMKEAAAQRAAETSATQSSTPPPAPPTSINNGIQINIGNGSSGSQPDPKAWHCSVHAFTQDFDAFGPTQLEAHQVTIQNCMRQYHPMHCQDVKCQVNR